MLDQSRALEGRPGRERQPAGRGCVAVGVDWIAQEELAQVLERVHVLRADVAAVDVERAVHGRGPETRDGERQIGDLRRFGGRRVHFFGNSELDSHCSESNGGRSGGAANPAAERLGVEHGSKLNQLGPVCQGLIWCSFAERGFSRAPAARDQPQSTLFERMYAITFQIVSSGILPSKGSISVSGTPWLITR